MHRCVENGNAQHQRVDDSVVIGVSDDDSSLAPKLSTFVRCAQEIDDDNQVTVIAKIQFESSTGW